MLAGLAGAEVDKFAQNRGDDWYNKGEAKRQGQDQARNMYDQYYVQDKQAGMYGPSQHGPPPQLAGRGWF
jgi:hypothetical protein